MGGDHHCERHGSEHAQYVTVIRLVGKAEHHTVVYSSMRVRNPNMLGYGFGLLSPAAHRRRRQYAEEVPQDWG